MMVSWWEEEEGEREVKEMNKGIKRKSRTNGNLKRKQIQSPVSRHGHSGRDGVQKGS
jgi:hypothetical protein